MRERTVVFVSLMTGFAVCCVALCVGENMRMSCAMRSMAGEDSTEVAGTGRYIVMRLFARATVTGRSFSAVCFSNSPPRLSSSKGRPIMRMTPIYRIMEIDLELRRIWSKPN